MNLVHIVMLEEDAKVIAHAIEEFDDWYRQTDQERRALIDMSKDIRNQIKENSIVKD